MRKYYIPTSSLNFNNILSSESISPKAFYHKRSFGYARWTSIPENPFENSLVLYDQLCAFNRPASDYEDHPMIVEITLDEGVASTLEPIDDHIFLSDHSIYIDPFSTNILFLSETHRQIALSMSDSSIETKVVHLFRNKIQSINPPSKTYSLPDSSGEKQSLNIKEIEKDKRLNRMKGVLYGYYIGAILSSSKEKVIKLNNEREIRNILTAILSSFDHKATKSQKDRLKMLYSSILPPARFLVKLSALVPPDGSLFNAIRALVIEEYGYIQGDVDIDLTISRLLTAQLSQKAKNPIMEEINGIISETEDSMSKDAHLLSVQDSPVVVIDGSLEHLNLDNLSDQDKKVVKAWVNEVLTKDEYNGKVSTFREMLSDDVTRKAKDVFESEWKGSYPEITLNSLRRHLRGSDFTHQWNNDIYSSMSAVLVRGDDWQKLLEYMQSKEMTDYSLAFAFYGALNGFANLSRDFTDVLFGRDRNYIAEVYKEFYGQLFKRDVVISANKQQFSAASIISAMNNMEDGFPELMDNISSKCSKARDDEDRYRELYTQCGGGGGLTKTLLRLSEKIQV